MHTLVGGLFILLIWMSAVSITTCVLMILSLIGIAAIEKEYKQDIDSIVTLHHKFAGEVLDMLDCGMDPKTTSCVKYLDRVMNHLGELYK